MAITYNSTDLRGKVVEPIMEAILFENNTIDKGLVTFEDDIKAETIFTEADASAVIQAYTSGVPTSAGDLTMFDTVVTPVKFQFYHEFDPNTLRFSRFKRNMKPSAWELMSTEFENIIVNGLYAKRVSLAMEYDFWNGATSATKTAVAALTAGTDNDEVSTEEKAYLAGLTIGTSAGNVSGLIDGVITKAIYNSSNQAGTAGVGGRVKVVGTDIDASNIKDEYDAIYEAIPDVVLDNQDLPTIFAPYAHRKFITTYNNNVVNYKDAFVESNGKMSFNGINIEFVPLKENVVYVAKKEHVSWCTDVTSDINKLQIEKIAANREDYFIKVNATIAAHISNQEFNVLYVG